MHGERILAKPDRHRLIESIVTRKRIGTQFELLDALAGAGCRVTQATVSRDIRELGLVKAVDPLGRPRYVLQERRTRLDPRATLTSILGQFGHRVTVAQNLLVLQSEVGSAPAIARRTTPEELLATILRQFGRRVSAAGNLVVVQSELGSAPAIGRALDELGHERIVGTLAGDDTCLAVTPSERDARLLAREVAELLP